MDGEEQTYEENRKLFGSFICNYHHTSFDYTAASVHRGRGDHFKYLSFNDDTCHHHDDPGAAGILYFSIAAADHDPVPPGDQRFYYKKHPGQQRCLRKGHCSFW